MKNFSTWMLVMFMIMFWFFRILVAVTYEMKIDFGGIEPFNQTMEIILLFVVLLCMILVVKRKVVGALIYLLAHGMYYGTTMISGLSTLFLGNTEISASGMGIYLNTFISNWNNNSSSSIT